ncbi:MAG: ABC transporter permease [Bacteroidota bacterium]
MFDFDKWQEIFATIRKHKMRTFLTALGVFWGIFMLVFLMGAGKGLENGVTGLFGGHARNSLYMGTNSTSKPYKGLPPGRRIYLEDDDVTAITVQFADKIQYFAPRLWMSSSEIIHNDKSGSFDVRGDSPDLLQIDAIKMSEGRFLNGLDMEQRRKVAVIGSRVKTVLFEEDEDPIGQYIQFRGAKFLVVGIITSDRRGSDAQEDEETVFIPITVAQQLTNRLGRVSMFTCAMYPEIRVSQVEDDVRALLKERHNIAPEDRRGVWSDNVEEEFREVMGLFFGIKFLVWFVGIGSLLAGVIGVGNIMLIVVKERTKEIGVRKAMGATPSSIISMILLESVFITTIAGYIGLLASTGIIALMSMALGEGTEFFANPEVDLGVAFTALIILIISGALTGLVPAMQAANVNPVIALKDE